MPDSGLMDKAHCKAESPESYGYQGLPEVSVRTSYFQTLVCSEKQGLLNDFGYARAASKKKSKNRSTGLGSRRMIFHTMKLIA